jgi:hypothetical protein
MILRRLIFEPDSEPLYGRYYEIDSRPLPNWATQASLAALLSFVSPSTAEKLSF